MQMGYEMLGKKYTAEFKLEKVREYLEKIENGEKISKADFAYQNNLSDSTFNDWKSICPSPFFLIAYEATYNRKLAFMPEIYSKMRIFIENQHDFTCFSS